MTPPSRRVACAVLLAAWWGIGHAEGPAETEHAPTPPSAALAKLLDATGKDGAPVVTPKARAYFDGLPGRAQEMTDQAVADEVITSPQHLGALLELGLPAATFEFALGDRCFLCHSDPEVQTGDTLFAPDPAAAGVPAHMALAGVVQDTHFRRGLSCAGCHGGDPTEPMGHDFVASWPQDTRRRREDRSWIPDFCGRCHSDSAFMRQFDPGLATDQLAKYRQSRHGIVLASGDSRAAQCVSCHGVHGILGAKSPLSTVYPTRVPDTCGKCHGDAKYMAGFRLPDGSPLPTNQLEQYRHSVHGRALLERGDLGAPACNDCHGNHAALPPEVASVSQVCRTCHARNGELFDGSKHKQAFLAHGWAECDVCHGKHAIEPTSDAMLAPGPTALCGGCHAKYAPNNPVCNATAAYFYQSLLRLADARVRLGEQANHLARQGLDVEQIETELSTLSDSLRQARSYVHSFNRSEFDQVAAAGNASIQKIGELDEAADAELRYRRAGLVVAVILLAILMLLLWMKVRRMESSPRN
jgi:predicted CXXCH cytochrome family protein